MEALAPYLTLFHLAGLALAVGSATSKVVLLLKCRTDDTFVPVYFKVVRPITRLIIVGLALLTLSGIGWLVIGYPFSLLLGVKVVLVITIWVLGPIIDKVIEPKFQKLAPAPGVTATLEFIRVRNQYLTLEVLATALFYCIIGIWVLG